ncbi:MAG: DUF1080 domain-containing protein [Planctomycetota bacterium]
MSTIRLAAILIFLVGDFSLAQEFKSGIVWPEPPIVEPGDSAKAPSDAVVLFDGTDLSAFENAETWKVENGYAEVGKKSIQTKQHFGDCQIHLEFCTPSEVKGKGQGRGNSGVYIMGRYEVQVLDSFKNTTYYDGQCGAVYKQQPPTVNASRGPGQWQTYDILFTAPQFNEDGSVKSKAYVTVLHNGVMIHNHFELTGGTFWRKAPEYVKHPAKGPIRLQNHGNPVRYRNIWVRENVKPLVGKLPEPQEEVAEPESQSTETAGS